MQPGKIGTVGADIPGRDAAPVQNMRRQAGGRGLPLGSGDADYAHRPCRIAVECRRAVCQRRAAVRNPDDGGVPGQGGERLLDNESPRALPISCGCEVVPVAPHSAQAEEQAVRSGGAGITADRADGGIQQPFPVALRGGCQQVRGRQSVYQFAQRAGHERTASVCAAPCAGCSAIRSPSNGSYNRPDSRT